MLPFVTQELQSCQTIINYKMKFKPQDVESATIDDMIRLRYRMDTTDSSQPSYSTYSQIAHAYNLSATMVRELTLKRMA